jgi:exopolysaccharide biosynthesis WecB/TagA/CpsF family protein
MGSSAPPDVDVRVPRPAEHVRLLGVRVDLFRSGDDVIEHLSGHDGISPYHLCYVNAHSLNLAFRHPRYRAALDAADLVLNDGIGVQLGAKMQGKRFHENLNGSDFTVRLLELCAERGWRVFLYGARPGVAASAGEQLTDRIPKLNIAGICDGYTSDGPGAIAARIRATGADVVIVALGQPAQELWLDEHLEATGCRLGLGVGAFLDFSSGNISRAPSWMNRLGIEWAFRLVREPRRMWRRYVVGNPLFLWRAWRQGATTVHPSADRLSR